MAPRCTFENINWLHRAIGLHIVEKDEPVSGHEFRFPRVQMGLSQADWPGISA
jgi:hypothetical protein